jgi:HTH-type transcriptional regulator / antitoxin HipB
VITSEQHYEATKARMARFEEALAHAEDRAAERHPLYQRVLRSNIEAELQTMYEQIAEYETSHCLSPTFTLNNATDLPLALIRARIAAGLKQEDLAERLGLDEEQVRHLEATRFADATPEQLQAVAIFLGVSPPQHEQTVIIRSKSSG